MPYNPDLDFGTGDFCVMGWLNTDTAIANEFIFSRGGSPTAGVELRGRVNSGGTLNLIGAGLNLNTTATVDNGQWRFAVFLRRSGVAYIYIDGEEAASVAHVGDHDNSTAIMTVGVYSATKTGAFQGSLALLRISGTAPTAEQIRKIYEDEKVLFQENAQATLYGTSDAVTALAHDPVTDLLHVGTSDGRSVFQGLRRVDNTTDAVGTAISASNNLIVEE